MEKFVAVMFDGVDVWLEPVLADSKDEAEATGFALAERFPTLRDGTGTVFTVELERLAPEILWMVRAGHDLGEDA
jgi:hypothetical protein